eukprot:TRINITY_DN16897_c0_g1_i2.p2 TRINITY_DN16897_c0_g1~~TRINITY_DN16897_c0_g1_i2.p2  ORF type:complete len:358 (-),score=86.06 TRINITY_DN16897_c0_g1_i2:2108-3181(-)
MTTKIRYAMIGFGGIAENRIAKEGFACDSTRLEKLAEAELVGACDLNPSRRDAVKAMNLKWYADMDALLADPDVDAVFIATSNSSHADIALKAMDAGKHVLVEKPMAVSVKDVEKMCSTARKHGLSLMVDHMMTGNAWNVKARAVVAEGELGVVNDSCFHMEFSYGSTLEEAATWRCAVPSELGGPIGDVASHCFYMAEFIMRSTIISVNCVYLPKTMNVAVEDGAYIKFRMDNGHCGSVRVSFSDARGGLQSTLDNLGYEIFGSSGVLRGHGTMFQLSGHPGEPVPVRLELDKFTERRDLEVERVVNIYQEVIRRHAASILDNAPADGYDGLHNLELVVAAHASAAQGGATTTIRR